jgi:DNA helicase-2/ATP-dependent DNA helicase PcrA
LVIAGAGSGKTNTLAHRVAHLIVRGAEPELLAEIEYRAESAESKSVFQGIKEGL